MKKAFTIVELLLAMVLMASLLVTSGIVFRVAAKSHMTAAATAEIARKLRGITDQLNADFKGLRKDAEIFVVWVPGGVDDDADGNIDRYERFDRIMFFATGDFQSYDEQAQTGQVLTGNTARITYMLAEDGSGQKAMQQLAKDRILARNQHIYTSDSSLVDFDINGVAVPPRTYWIDPLDIQNTFIKLPPPPPPLLNNNIPSNNTCEYDNLTAGEWLNIPWGDKQEMLTIASGIKVDAAIATDGGLVVDAETPQNVHQFLCQGVGEFSIQCYLYTDPVFGMQWFPEIERDNIGNLVTDFAIDPGDPAQLDASTDPLRLIYPWPWDLHPVVDAGIIDLGSRFDAYPRQMVDQANFNSIPGLGRALKFTFTLYDSRGVFENGKKFTHIVYLDE